MKNASRKLSLVLLAFAPLLLASCIESPREKLIGRWFNRSNSIRFEANGAIDWNSTAGRGKGVYYLDTAAVRSKPNVPIKNLTVKMQQGDSTIYGEYEVHYMGHDRIRLTRLDGEQAAGNASLTILKRATAADNKKANVVSLNPAS
jgi:hypothetical protein